MLCFEKISSPIGDINIIADELNLIAVIPDISWHKYEKRFKNLTNVGNKITRDTHSQLNEYFRKERREFDLPLSFGGTDFQNLAWHALLDIPYGQTISYGEQAKRIGRPKAVRAIGGANGANLLAIVVPCHRVIGKSGDLTGYASGINIKKELLKLESN